jgi:hypothetical protein
MSYFYDLLFVLNLLSSVIQDQLFVLDLLSENTSLCDQ